MTIRNDATRLRIVTKDKRQPRAVVARQGQVLLDTTFDQQSRHHLYRLETETVDVLGSPGRLVVPEGNNGFKVTANGAAGNFDIGAGRGYLDGWLLENPASCKLGTQPHPWTGPAVTVPAIVGVKALVRHIDPVEDPVLADVALGDAQASGLSLVDWQVFPLPVTGGPASCATALSNSDWQKLAAPSTGTLAVTVQTAAASTDPCSLTPGGGYTRLENLLYRIEVHSGEVKAGYPTADGQRFNLHNLNLKLSRRNASTLVRITGLDGTTNADITVSPPMLDPRNWFAPGLYAEVVSIHDDVNPPAVAGSQRLFRIAQASDEHVILETSLANVTAIGANPNGGWFLRLWDTFPNGTGLATVSASGGAMESAEIDLGDGLKIKLGGGPAGTFRRGDYWTFAARADGSIDWPVPGGPAQLMPPHGPEIRYAPIAAVNGTVPAPMFEDCRIPFATLTDRALLYRGGDGQSVFAPSQSGMVTLPGKLRVAVMRGETPVPGVTVRWSLFPGATPCTINGSACTAAPGNFVASTTGPDGLAEVDWAIDASKQLLLHRVQAWIEPIPAASGTPPVVFSATFETAEHTAYFPGNCKYLTKVNNVQDALDTLCAELEEPRTILLTSIQLLNSKGATIDLMQKDVIGNGAEVPYSAIGNGIVFEFSNVKLGMDIEDYDPIVEVELDLPYPSTDPNRLYWTKASTVAGTELRIDGPFGFQRIRLDGKIKLVQKGTGGRDSALVWTPSDQASHFIETAPIHQWGQKINLDFASQLKDAKWKGAPVFDRALCRIRLRSALIWANDPKTKERIYLNAEHLGTKESLTRRELSIRDRDPQRAADLDMFVYLTVRTIIPIKPINETVIIKP